MEVEARLQALEKAVAECKADCAANAHTHTSDGGDVSAVVAALKAQWPNKFTDL